jgi:tRNA modification GTPase
VNVKNEKLSDVIALYMKAPRSYTGEDVVEIQSLGGEVVTEEILKTVLSGGAVLAERGEFTKRAVLSGKIDLAQAEAIIDLIEARTKNEIKEAALGASGEFSRKIKEVVEGLEEAIAKTAVFFDFPEDEEISENEILESIRAAKTKAEKIEKNFVFRRIDKYGIRIAITGRANVGKSSLLNALISEERAIVTARPGTTRDAIEEEMLIGEKRVIFTDTAGIRKAKGAPEKEGVARAKKKIAEADIVLVVSDISKKENEHDREIKKLAKKTKTIYIHNKIDLLNQAKQKEKTTKAAEKAPLGSEKNPILISAKNKTGLENILYAIEKAISELSEADLERKPSINFRQEAYIKKAIAELAEAEDALSKGLGIETIDVIIKQIREYLLGIVGEGVSEDVIDSVFERFCIGK